ncbi:hypothetical protein A9Q99_06515 [Gammaproteobacteria bacterium 45_16_T64]|nr:hypothetical protein A9Q99_06515 [Gammaproteobacteria bacterium 45_16_T64]
MPGEQEPGHYVNFESSAVRPLAKSANGKQVFVTNTPNHSLDIFEYNDNGLLEFVSSVPVGIDPVAVAISDNGEAWVVNHISDSISIVALDKSVPHVRETLLVGDEPRDIVFAKGKAFITTAHRGQHRVDPSIAQVEGAGNPQLHEPGVSRADIWIFDSAALGEGVGGTPLQIIELFGDTPRALAVTPNEDRVYVSVLNSGNQTSVIHESVMCHGFTDDDLGREPCRVLDGVQMPKGRSNGELPGGRAAPGVNKDGVPQPWTSMIVGFDKASGEWRDSAGRNFSNGIRFTLPDNDVFAINANTLEQEHVFSGVGTTLFNMAVNPVNGNFYVSNTEANNRTRFEGPGAVGKSTVQGDIARSRVTVIDPTDASVRPRHLNRHINYDDLKGNAGIKKHSVANPTGIAVDDSGERLYVAAMGSEKVAVYSVQNLEDDSQWDSAGEEFDPIESAQNHIQVRGGPVGVLLNEQRNQLIVHTRFDNSIVLVDLERRREISRVALRNPEPAYVREGRSILYDAQRSSSNGEASCASCHIFSDTDHLSWNLGNPDASNGVNPQPFPTFAFSALGCDFVGPDDDSCQLLNIVNGDGERRTIASMKGPMFTQTLRGMSTHGHMHWRGDRSLGYFGNDVDQTLNEKISFKNFIVAFEGLLGLDIELPDNVNAPNKSEAVIQLEKDMDKFADFSLGIQMPPNPIRALDNGLSESASIGRDFFFGDRRSDGLEEDSLDNGADVDGVNCEGCHGVDPAKGFYGSRGEVAHGGEIQILKVPQLRNLYTRVGMFGLPDRAGFLPSHTKQNQGDQIRGFGFLHDGATDSLLNFLRGGVFDNGETPCDGDLEPVHGCEFNVGSIGIPNETVRQGLVDFMMEFDSDLAPVVGQQVTLSGEFSEDRRQRLNLLEERAMTAFTSKIIGGDVFECDLVAQGVVNQSHRRYLLNARTNMYMPDTTSLPNTTPAELRVLAQGAGNALTFTCLVPGSGRKMALDFDLNGILNGDE